MTTPAACEAGGSQAAPVAPGVDPNAVPTAETLGAVWDLTVRDREGKEVPFKDIVNASPRVLVMFIRHWFCPACQTYMQKFVGTVTPEVLSSLPVKTSIVIIGNGGYQLIDHWKREANCPFPVYADPDLKLYKAFHLPRTMGSHGSEYYTGNVFQGFFKAMSQVIWMPHKVHKAGDPSQNGGELLFEPATAGEDGIKEVTWCHRMQHAADHAKFEVVFKKLGIENLPRIGGQA